jgi:hypothetical protein
LIKAICLAIITMEETAAGGPGRFIPEHCRVHHYRLVDDSRGSGGWQAITLTRRPSEGKELVAYEVPLENGLKDQWTAGEHRKTTHFRSKHSAPTHGH